MRPGSVRTLRFDGRASTTIPVGGTLLSDGTPFPVKAFESLTVTLYLAGETGPTTFHHFASATSYRADGDHRADVSGTAFKETSTSWYFLSGVEVTGGRDTARRSGIVTFGDSITDGVGAATDADNRYPDELAERLAAAGSPRAVLNQGIAGNQVVNDTTWAGEKALTRFREDVLNERGVGTVILLEGINDIGGSTVTFPAAPTPDVSVTALIKGHRTLIRPEHLDRMGFTFPGGRHRIRLAPEVRRIAPAMMEELTGTLLKDFELTQEQVRFWVLHSAGRRVLENAQTLLGLSDADLAYSRDVLRRYGNLSSATVLFVRDAVLRSGRPKPGDFGLMMALGHGFAAEGAILRF